MRAWWVVLATVAALACNSGTEPRVTAANPLADSADQVMFGVSTVITNRGVLRAQLAADTGYFFDGNSRIEVRREKTTFYTNTGQPNATLTSVEGTYNMRRGQMEARKNVVVVTTDGKRLETEQLRYEQATDQISSDSAFVLTEPTRTLRGIGFTSDPDLTNVRVKKVLRGSGSITLPGPDQ
ncbi:MAG TPA: LPS export ABC transporter periplasmic protein LptC [Gemmatimonadaceae bacterium]|jgi:LPS export ABC transporter protein LptC|nr:LPS export ABC transporter periplasmic protein LptC [Gemmatimonadaceae bacterium]